MYTPQFWCVTIFCFVQAVALMAVAINPFTPKGFPIDKWHLRSERVISLVYSITGLRFPVSIY